MSATSDLSTCAVDKSDEKVHGPTTHVLNGEMQILQPKNKLFKAKVTAGISLLY